MLRPQAATRQLLRDAELWHRGKEQEVVSRCLGLVVCSLLGALQSIVPMGGARLLLKGRGCSVQFALSFMSPMPTWSSNTCTQQHTAAQQQHKKRHLGMDIRCQLTFQTKSQLLDPFWHTLSPDAHLLQIGDGGAAGDQGWVRTEAKGHVLAIQLLRHHMP